MKYYKVYKSYILKDLTIDYGGFIDWQDVKDIIKGYKKESEDGNLIIYTRKKSKYFYMVEIL